MHTDLAGTLSGLGLCIYVSLGRLQSLPLLLDGVEDVHPCCHQRHKVDELQQQITMDEEGGVGPMRADANAS